MPDFKAEILRQSLELAGDASLDPSLFPEFLSKLSEGVNSRGTFVLRSSDAKGTGVASPYVHEAVQAYFSEGWAARDIRFSRGVGISIRRGIVTDLDLTTDEEIRGDAMYQELLARFGLKWFAALTFPVGSETWAFSIQRTAAQGPFSNEETRSLLELRSQLITNIRVAGMSARIRARGMMDGMARQGDSALLIDAGGWIVDCREGPGGLPLGRLRIQNRRLVAAHGPTNDALQHLIRNSLVFDPRMPSGGGLLCIPARRKPPLVVWVCPVRPDAMSGFGLMHSLVIIRDLGSMSPPPIQALTSVFAMTPAEARLAQALMRGGSLKDVAAGLGISWESARTQLKAIFAKTGTGRQSELLAILTRLPA